MNKKRAYFIIVLMLVIVLLFFLKSNKVYSPSSEEIHPKLFFDFEDIPSIKEKINNDETINYIFNDDLSGVIRQSNSALNMGASTLFSTARGMHYIKRLSSAYLFSDDSDDYGEKCRELTLYAKNYNSNMECYGPDTYYDESLILYTLNIGYDFCYDKFSDGEKQEIRDKIVDYVESAVYNCQFQVDLPSTPNKDAMTAGMIGLSYVNIYDEVSISQKTILEKGKLLSDNILKQNLLSHSFGEDGSFSEGILYLAWSYKFLVPYFEARERYDGYSFYNEYPRIKESIKWIVYNMVPEGNGKTNDFNDALLYKQHLKYHNTYLDWIIHREKNSEYSRLGRWAWEHVFGEYSGSSSLIMNSDVISIILWFDSSVELENPSTYLDNSGYFEDGGWYFYRTGWQDGSSSDDIMFQFYSGKFFGGHNQEDKNQYTLYEGDSYYLKDSGYSMPEEDQPYYKTDYHNLILINENGQITQTAGCGSDGEISNYFYSSGLDTFIGDNSFAYDGYSEYILNDPNGIYGYCWFDDANPVLKSERNVLIIKDFNGKPYFLILDDVNKNSQPNNYKLFFQHQKSGGTVSVNEHIGISHNSRTLDINFINPLIGDLSNINIDENDKNKLVESYMDNVVNPYFVYSLIPHDANNLIEYLNVGGGHGFSLTNWDLKDVILINDGSGIVSYESVESDGKFIYLRYVNNVLKEFSLNYGTSFVIDEIDYVSSEEISSVYSDGANVFVQKKDVNYEIYGPNVENVYVGKDIYPFNILGNYVYPYFSSETYKKCVNGECIDFYGVGNDECGFDSDCSAEIYCGNDIVNENEECDGLNLGGESCSSLGYDSGVLACLDNCSFDIDGCVNVPCGDGVVNENEECDGLNLGDESCLSLGYQKGNLSCFSDCKFNILECKKDVLNKPNFYIVGGILIFILFVLIIFSRFFYDKFKKT